MKKDGNLPARQGITTVYELNDLLNELWHAIPPGKGRKVLSKVERVLHQRICNQQNRDCWLCQYRYWGDIEIMLGISHPEPEESDEPEPQGFDLVRWLNDSINRHLRARHLGQTPPQSLEVLMAIHEEVSRRKSHTANCMFCLAKSVEGSALRLTDKQADSLIGFMPMLNGQSDEDADEVA